MALDVTLGSYASIANVLTTELNALASAGKSVPSGAIDNRTAKAMYEALELVVTFASSPTAGTVVELYKLESLDETNYNDGDSSVIPPDTSLVGVFPVQAVGTVQRIILGDPVQLLPGLYKYMVVNNTNQNFSASGHTLKRRPFSIKAT